MRQRAITVIVDGGVLVRWLPYAPLAPLRNDWSDVVCGWLMLCEMWRHGVVIPTQRRDSDSLRERTILFLGKVRPLALWAILSSLRLTTRHLGQEQPAEKKFADSEPLLHSTPQRSPRIAMPHKDQTLWRLA